MNASSLTQAAKRQVDADRREQTVLQYYNMVRYMALRLASRLPSHISADDLFNTGIIGLIDAIDKFDESQGIQFETYARIRVRGAMLDEIRSMDWVPRSLRQKSAELEKTCTNLEQKLGHYPSDEEIAGELSISLDDYYRMLDEIKGIRLLPEEISEVICESRGGNQLSTESDELFQKAYREEIRKHLAEGISALSKKEQLVLSLYYYEELTMKEIGVVMGYTESRISQIHTKAVLRLRVRLTRKLKRDDLPDYLQSCEARA
jgi:RNA polymerase sigma factor for flagellar operon FliA